MTSYISSYHALLLVGMDCNCMRTSSEQRTYTASPPHIRKKNLFHRIIRMMQIFMREVFMVQNHPQNILTLNYFWTVKYIYSVTYIVYSHVTAGNESCPQPQTSEHLAAIEIMRLRHIIILQNKIDIIKESQAQEQYQDIVRFVQGELLYWS